MTARHEIFAGGSVTLLERDTDPDPVSSSPPAGGGEVSPAAAHCETRVAGGDQRADPPREGAATVIEAAGQDKTPARSASDLIYSEAVDILMTAADCIDNRASQRDQPSGERSMARAVATFSALTGHDLSERDGWIFMALLKMARAQGGRHHIDDYVDGAAYLALAGESLHIGIST